MRKATILLLAFLVCVPFAFAADDDAKEQKQPGTPTYESPILSLLFLPVNLLIKMASVMPKPSQTSSQPAPSGSGK